MTECRGRTRHLWNTEERQTVNEPDEGRCNRVKRAVSPVGGQQVRGAVQALGAAGPGTALLTVVALRHMRPLNA